MADHATRFPVRSRCLHSYCYYLVSAGSCDGLTRTVLLVLSLLVDAGCSRSCKTDVGDVGVAGEMEHFHPLGSPHIILTILADHATSPRASSVFFPVSVGSSDRSSRAALLVLSLRVVAGRNVESTESCGNDARDVWRPTEESLAIKAKNRKWRTLKKSRNGCKILILETSRVRIDCRDRFRICEAAEYVENVRSAQF